MIAIELVRTGNRDEFISYCRKHRFDHDESFLSDHDLEAFDPENGEDFGFLVRTFEGEVRGAAALMFRPELRAVGKARFRIFHVEAELGEPRLGEAYRELLAALTPHAAGLDWLYLFLPESAASATSIVRNLGFSIERQAWLLERELGKVPAPSLPPGYTFREALIRGRDGEPGPDAEAWCSIANAAFRDLAGHTELLPSRLLEENDVSLDFKGSWLLLEEEGRPIGLCATVRDVENRTDGAFLGPVAVLPAWQGRGLGRAALRAGLAAAKEAGCKRCSLSVNAENENAVQLYIGEDFRKKYVMVCWHRAPWNPGP